MKAEHLSPNGGTSLMSFYSTDSDSRSRTGRVKPADVLFWILILLTPLISAGLIQLLTGTSALRLDAWNTTWNDELGYYRVVRILRYYGVPRGMTGFNEITSGNVPYGPYNVFTYIPYYLISLVTGCDSHNYIYFCNIIMAVLANIVFVALVRPGRMQSLLTALFFLTQLIAARYTWSGMAEASYHFYIVVFMGLVIWYLKSPDASRLSKDLALLAMVLLTFAFGVMRPYFAVMFLIPLYLVVFRNNKIGEFSRFISTLLILAAMFGTVVLMYYFMGFIAEYFEVAPALKLAQIIRSGQAGQIFQSLLQVNKESVRSAIDMIKEYRWAGGIAFLFYFEWAILFVEYIAALVKRKKDGSAAVMFLLLVSGIMIYEATILLYKSYQLHRMLLAITIAYSLFLIAFGTILPWVNAAAVIACVCFYIVMKPAAFALPQINADSITDEQLQEYKETLIKNLPMQQVPAIGMFDAPDSLDPYWENTVAKITEDNNVQLSFVLPDYLSLNFCSEKYMSQCIKNDGFSSRYILVKTDSDLNEMCRTRYKNIWEGIGHSIYDRTKKTEDQGGI